MVIAFGVMNSISSGGGLFGGHAIKLKNNELTDAIRARPRQIHEVNWQDTTLTGLFEVTHENGAPFVSVVPHPDSSAAIPIQNALTENKISWQIDRPPLASTILSLAGVTIVPLMLLVVFYFVLIRPSARSSSQSSSVGMSRSTGQRLMELRELQTLGLITDLEYAERRAKILEET